MDPSENWKKYTDARLDESLEEARKSRERSYTFIKSQDPNVTDEHLAGLNWKNLNKLHTRLQQDMGRRMYSAGMNAGKALLLGAGKRDLRARDVSAASEAGGISPSPFGDTRSRVSPDPSEEPIRRKRKRPIDLRSPSPSPEPPSDTEPILPKRRKPSPEPDPPSDTEPILPKKRKPSPDPPSDTEPILPKKRKSSPFEDPARALVSPISGDLLKPDIPPVERLSPDKELQERDTARPPPPDAKAKKKRRADLRKAKKAAKKTRDQQRQLANIIGRNDERARQAMMEEIDSAFSAEMQALGGIGGMIETTDPALEAGVEPDRVDLAETTEPTAPDFVLVDDPETSPEPEVGEPTEAQEQRYPDTDTDAESGLEEAEAAAVAEPAKEPDTDPEDTDTEADTDTGSAIEGTLVRSARFPSTSTEASRQGRAFETRSQTRSPSRTPSRSPSPQPTTMEAMYLDMIATAEEEGNPDLEGILAEFVRYLNSAMHPMPSHVDTWDMKPQRPLPDQLAIARLRNDAIQKLAYISADPMWEHHLESVEESGLGDFHLPELSHRTVSEQRAVDMARASIKRRVRRFGLPPLPDEGDEKKAEEPEPEEKSAEPLAIGGSPFAPAPPTHAQLGRQIRAGLIPQPHARYLPHHGPAAGGMPIPAQQLQPPLPPPRPPMRALMQHNRNVLNRAPAPQRRPPGSVHYC